MFCSKELTKVISDVDYAICNFEAPIGEFGEAQPKAGIHHFQKKFTIEGLKKQGFNLLCLANNHIMDFGISGLTATINEAKRLGLDIIGAGENSDNAYKPLIKVINQVKIGFINACEAQFGVIDSYSDKSQPGYAWINSTLIDKQIIKLKKDCDFVILLCHAGLEHYPIPQKEWRLRYKHFCDLGTDVVIGSHPHVPQGYEVYNDSLIFYSLGNFYFDSVNYQNKEDQSYSVVLSLEKNQRIKWELIHHHKHDGYVQISSPEKHIDINLLNECLGDDFEKLWAEMSLKAYNEIVRNELIYSLLPFPYDGNLKSSLRKILYTILGKRKKIDKDLLTQHLLRNEAYYYAARHALELKAKQKYGVIK